MQMDSNISVFIFGMMKDSSFSFWKIDVIVLSNWRFFYKKKLRDNISSQKWIVKNPDQE
jgi:hypothetical protein